MGLLSNLKKKEEAFLAGRKVKKEAKQANKEFKEFRTASLQSQKLEKEESQLRLKLQVQNKNDAIKKRINALKFEQGTAQRKLSKERKEAFFKVTSALGKVAKATGKVIEGKPTRRRKTAKKKTAKRKTAKKKTTKKKTTKRKTRRTDSFGF